MAAASIRPSESIPTFLLPAFQSPAASRTFATTSPCLSKIGSAPLSVPPEVTFKIMPASGRAGRTRVQAMSTVHIKGPLGELSMEVPAYVNINQDPSLPGPTLTVENSRDAKQRAMWGTNYLICIYRAITKTNQALPAHTSKTTFSASARAIPLSCVSMVSGTEPQSKTRPRPCNQNTQARNSLI